MKLLNPKIYLAKVASVFERAFDAIRPKRVYGDVEIDPYFGHATPTEIVLRGRVLTRRAREAVEELEEDPTLWTNFKSMIALFNTREIADVRITCDALETLSDEEGYFELALPRPSGQSGWSAHKVCFGESEDMAELTALIPSPEAEFGIISDIDDTLIKTDAWSLRRNLWNSLTGNAQSRLVFPDAVSLISKLHAERNPVYYVSSSPWNLHGFLGEIFERAGLVRGPKFLRDLGISDRQFITGTHGEHKGNAIDEILASNPNLSFILLGDTGQYDAHVYHNAILRHPGRIKQIILRAPNPNLSKSNQIWIDKIKALGTPLFIGEDYKPLLESLA